MEFEELSITSDPVISAIYYALLQCGYDFYAVERDAAAVKNLQSFITPEAGGYNFFAEIRQNTCEVYPYWPRAAMLEAATFFIELPQACFADFDGYKKVIFSAENISDAERGQPFWDWVQHFPAAINRVLQSPGFRRYWEWEKDWIAAQNRQHAGSLQKLADVLTLCRQRFHSPFQHVRIVLDPIKCVYSADHHRNGDTFTFCLGALRAESVIHEFIHHAVHPVVERRKAEILRRHLQDLGLDASYYLQGSEKGKLNAFEEYLVRRLTDKILHGEVPDDLEAFFDAELTAAKKA